jgi:hypothetical protein
MTGFIRQQRQTTHQNSLEVARFRTKIRLEHKYIYAFTEIKIDFEPTALTQLEHSWRNRQSHNLSAFTVTRQPVSTERDNLQLNCAVHDA